MCFRASLRRLNRFSPWRVVGAYSTNLEPVTLAPNEVWCTVVVGCRCHGDVLGLVAFAWISSVNKQNHVYPAVKLETCHGLMFGLENQHYGIEIGHLKYQLASIVILHIEVQNIFFAVRNQFSSEVYSWCSCTTYMRDYHICSCFF